ncbi:MAG: hypothetical protein AABX34_05400 [Nanoarchaeota archaeon]
MVDKNITVKIVDATEHSDQNIIILKNEKKKFYEHIKNALVFEE